LSLKLALDYCAGFCTISLSRNNTSSSSRRNVASNVSAECKIFKISSVVFISTERSIYPVSIDFGISISICFFKRP
jgi:FlaA1/EpsC-like NDP-sugar epimerase